MKKTKLVVLVLFLLVLTFVTYPTLSSIGFSSASTSWRNEEDALGVVAVADSVSHVTLSINGYFDSTSETGGSIPGASAELHLAAFKNPDVTDPVYVYYQAIGAMADLFERCIRSAPPDSVFKGVSEISEREAFEAGRVVGDFVGTGTLRAGTVRYFRQQVFYAIDDTYNLQAPGCMLETERFWISRGSRSVFSAPSIYVDFVHDFDTQPEDLIFTQLPESVEPREGEPRACVLVTTSWGVGVTPGGSTPPSSEPVDRMNAAMPSRIDGAYAENGADWLNCLNLDTSIYFGSRLLNPITSIDLVDNLAGDVASRSTFLAGALVGVMGALFIEVYNAFFEVLERRARGKDGDSSISRASPLRVANLLSPKKSPPVDGSEGTPEQLSLFDSEETRRSL